MGSSGAFATLASLVALAAACTPGRVTGVEPTEDDVFNESGADGGGSEGDEIPSGMVELLNLHNTERASVQSVPLTWNAALAVTADEWATGCDYGHDPNRQVLGQTFGENVAAGGIGFGTIGLAQLWFDEEQHYDCYDNSCASGETCGHYTQIVWDDTTELGCAEADCSGTLFLVCRYLPAGNYIGERPVPAASCP